MAALNEITMEQTKEPCDYPLTICKPGEPVLFCRKAKPCPIHSNTTEQTKAWWEINWEHFGIRPDVYKRNLEDGSTIMPKGALKDIERFIEDVVEKAEILGEERGKKHGMRRGREQGLREALDLAEKFYEDCHMRRNSWEMALSTLVGHGHDSLRFKLDSLLSQQEEKQTVMSYPVVTDPSMKPGEWSLESDDNGKRRIRSNPPQQEGK